MSKILLNLAVFFFATGCLYSALVSQTSWSDEFRDADWVVYGKIMKISFMAEKSIEVDHFGHSIKYRLDHTYVKLSKILKKTAKFTYDKDGCLCVLSYGFYSGDIFDGAGPFEGIKMMRTVVGRFPYLTSEINKKDVFIEDMFEKDVFGVFYLKYLEKYKCYIGLMIRDDPLFGNVEEIERLVPDHSALMKKNGNVDRRASCKSN